jgi:NAD+ synthase (glutamine-hydrolysing)
LKKKKSSRQKPKLRIALAQIDSLLGNFKYNAEKIVSFALRAKERRCDLVVFPEAALFGYHPVDLLERPKVVEEQMRVLKELSKTIPKDIGVLVGAIVPNTKKGKAYWNAAVLLERGKKPVVFAKQLLPTYDVFNESRHIQPGDTTQNIFKFRGSRILVTICEDIWGWRNKKSPRYSEYEENPLTRIKKGSVDLILNLSASPFTTTKFEDRRKVVGETVKHFECPMVYVNMVGGQDELIFDGGSFAVNAKRKVIAQCVRFEEDFNVLDLGEEDGSILEVSDRDPETIRRALVLGIRDFLFKTGFKRIHLGLSGGIDSALVACLAADAVGPANVMAIGLEGPYTTSDSVRLAKQLCENLGIGWHDLSIKDLYKKAVSEFESSFGHGDFGLMNENIQARLRGLMLMAYANREISLLLGTSNKSELAVGYSTLYGDLCGGLLPIGDLLKTEVYELCRHYNADSELIPDQIISRAPSAELREGQKDQDSLPPYDELDPIVRKLVDGLEAPKNAVEEKILRMLLNSEFKRWQAAPILKVSNHAFGQGRKLPIAHQAYG